MTDKLVFTPSAEDLTAAYRLHMKQQSGKRAGIFLLFGLAIGVAIAAINSFEPLALSIGLIAGATLWAGFVALVLTIILPAWWVPKYAKKIYRQQKDLHLETATWWDEDKFYSSNEQGHSHMALTDIVKWRANEHILLIYRSDQLFNFLPTRLFRDPADKADLIQRLRLAGVKGEDKS